MAEMMAKMWWPEWEDVGLCILTLSAVALLSMAGIAIAADHRIRSYCIETAESAVVCVMADRNWAPDSRVFCSDDVDKAARVMKLSADALAAGRK